MVGGNREVTRISSGLIFVCVIDVDDGPLSLGKRENVI